MHAQQVPATKPSPLTSNPPSNTSQSPAALRGATTAFQPKVSIPTVSVTAVSTGARLAAFAAGTQAAQRTTQTSPERQNGHREPSPSRGRQLIPNTVSSPTGVNSGASPSTSAVTFQAHLISPSNSTLAARHASTHSRSPQRSPNRAPRTGGTETRTIEEGEQYKPNNNALSGATASMTANSAREKAQNEIVQSVKSRALNFERTPSLPAPNSTPTPSKLSRVSSSVSRGSETLAPSTDNEPVLLLKPGGERMRAHSMSRVPRLPVPVSRQSSEESVATVSAITPENIGKVEKLLKDTRPRIPERGTSARIPASRSPPQTRPKAQDDYRNTMSVNDLANAMVASSLASSRATSPSKRPPLPPSSRRRSRSFPALYERKVMLEGSNASKPRNKPLKPARPMKHTLRKVTSSDDDKVELTKRGRKHWMRKHPNMHAEGDRKRWRDKVTEPERRRYEGLFAANRGLLIGQVDAEPSTSTLLDNTALENLVVNVVVRDIWERSRLPREVLEEIYDLVCPEENHTLNREQFVVGLWLIDQRLKGRKLPIKVSPSVWASVRHSHGIKIRQHIA